MKYGDYINISDFLHCFGISNIETSYPYSEREPNYIKLTTKSNEYVTIEDGMIREVDVFGVNWSKTPKTEIKKVIFNPPATIVYWADGTKTVVKCSELDDFDEEKGLAMAVCKKIFGEHYYTGVIKKYAKTKSETKEPKPEMHSCCDGHVRYTTENVAECWNNAVKTFKTSMEAFKKAYNDATANEQPDTKGKVD